MNFQAKLPEHEQLWLLTTNWLPQQQHQQLWQKFYEEILSTNQSFNLTRIKVPEDFWEKNIWDSVAPVLPYELSNKKIIDIGTGGGFPGIPVAIVFPQAEFTLMDATAKKINFIQQTVQKLGLNNVKTLINRAEIIGQDEQYREKFELALIRAVAETSVCLEYTLPLLKKAGIAILYRGEWEQEEEKIVNQVAEQLGGKLIKIINHNTPINHYTRHNIYVEKIADTPKEFPRAVGKPPKQPLSKKVIFN
jgi:16S rRNA (guanine527-N7)-methyltransferase